MNVPILMAAHGPLALSARAPIRRAPDGDDARPKGPAPGQQLRPGNGRDRGTSDLVRALAVVAATLLMLPGAAVAQGPIGPLDDLAALGQGAGQAPDTVPTVKRDAPPFAAVPRAQCGPGSKPEPDIQGRVPAGSAPGGLWCNVTLVSHHGESGGFKVFRYVDRAGHECAYYDTALF